MLTSRWQTVECAGDVPSGRIGHVLCVDTSENFIYLYGGVNDSPDSSSRYLADYYELDYKRKRWRAIPTEGEATRARAFHTAVYHNHLLYVFGGCNGRGRFNRLFTLDSRGHCEIIHPQQSDQLHEIPPTRYCHSAVAFEGNMYVFAGKCGGRNSNHRLADLHAFNFGTRTWTTCHQYGELPPPRSAHGAFTWGRSMMIFGGRNTAGECCEDLYYYLYDTGVWTNVRSATTPFGRARHSVVVHNGCVVVFGGWNGRRKLNDLFFYTIDSEVFETFVEADVLPSRRECHVAVVCQNTMVVFGGRFRGNFMSDVCSLYLGSRSLVDCCREWLRKHDVVPWNLMPPRMALTTRRLIALHSDSNRRQLLDSE